MWTPKPDAAELVSTTDPQAEAIYQAGLDRITNLFWARDWDQLADCIAVPNRIGAPDTERVFATLDEWIVTAKAARETFAQIGATEYHRLGRAARFTDEARTRIIGLHETYILRGSAFAMPAYRAFMLMRQEADGNWRSNGLYSEQRDTTLPTIHAERLKPLSR
ncbi:hypothetical protein [Mameliella alba]|uniref:hypothetical protein n=1 Tax=Mameliella alba TaxID=561184 RepID=UPI000B532B4C|nr:hypothetical protein [Mameliella alba]MBY6119850.1 hypothetical protein [Mameliella alba]OWV45437.1 hypothetical protein CDZ95_00250 [Mameliella alba]OWV65831.1 hypothetical protein CDZ97_08180 [Mameliella alba]